MTSNKFDKKMFNRLHPIGQMEVFKNGTVVLHRRPGPPRIRERPRKEITAFSNGSRQRLALVACETSVEFESLMTLTYGVNYPMNGLEVKRTLRVFLNRLKTWYARSIDYLWFLEFQKRGAPHIHILTDIPPPVHYWQRQHFARIWVDDSLNLLADIEYCRLSDRKVVNERIAMLWFHSRPQQWEALRSREGASRYAVKYALKGRQKAVPKEYRDVGRFWGCTRRVGNLKSSTVFCNEDDVRRIIRRTRPGLEAKAEILPRVIFGGIK